MRPLTRKLIAMAEKGREGGWWWNRTHAKLLLRRERKSPPQLEFLRQGLERLLPVLQETGLRLGLENLPSWEAIPTETEALELMTRLADSHIGYWHDFGHGQIRENLGFTVHDRMLERLQPHLVGFHIHDVEPPAHDHIVPSFGKIDFSLFRDIVRKAPEAPRVIELDREAPVEAVLAGLKFLREQWEAPTPPAASAEARSFYG